jgi:hypothetical protein
LNPAEDDVLKLIKIGEKNFLLKKEDSKDFVALIFAR